MEYLEKQTIVGFEIDLISAIAKAAGFVISVGDLEAAAKAELLSAQAVELSDEELESVTGGTMDYEDYNTNAFYTYRRSRECMGL